MAIFCLQNNCRDHGTGIGGSSKATLKIPNACIFCLEPKHRSAVIESKPAGLQSLQAWLLFNLGLNAIDDQ